MRILALSLLLLAACASSAPVPSADDAWLFRAQLRYSF